MIVTKSGALLVFQIVSAANAVRAMQCVVARSVDLADSGVPVWCNC